MGKLNLLARIGMKALIYPLRKLDYSAARKLDFLIANSNHTKKMIKKYYGRSSVVIHPPVATKSISKLKNKFPRHGLIITGRHTPYKNFILAVKACTKLGLDLTVVGEGPETAKLKAAAGPTIEFKGWVSDEERSQLIASAEGFIFPGIDDFGISAVEALAAGTPVIALEGGGALDYVKPGVNGIFFAEPTEKSLINALNEFIKLKFNSDAVSSSAEQFSEAQFKLKMKSFIENALEKK